jgi:hypothetical protein
MAASGATQQPRALHNYSIAFRSVIDREAAHDEAKSPHGSILCETIRGSVLNTNYRYTS